jgi:phage terminase small subunit
MALSPKHRMFCEEYLRTWNATDAYQAVYPKTNRDTARANGARLLANASISEEIDRRVDEQAMSANEVLTRLGAQARAEYSAYLLADGTVDLTALIAAGKSHLIKGTKPTQWGVVVEFYDAQTALVQIGKHHKLFTDQVQQSGEVVVRVEYGDKGTDGTSS